MRRLIAAWAAALLLGAATAPAAAQVRFSVAAGAAALRGDATYSIGGAYSGPIGTGTVNDPLSELTFPLDVTLATLAVAAEAPLSRGTLLVAGEFARSVTEDAGTLRDRDWTRRDRPDLITISSESDARLDAAVADLRLSWRLLEVGGAAFGLPREQGGAWLAVGAGYLWQRFSFEAYDLQQLAAEAEGVAGRAGKVAEYEALYRIPYAEVSAGLAFGSPAGAALSVEGRLGASPWAMADDVDDHLLRAKRSEGDCSGTALHASVRTRAAAGRFFLEGSVGLTTLEASGVQRQTRYEDTSEGPAGVIADIGQSISSGQTRFDVALGMRF